MAFDARDLSVLNYANGFTLWHYRTGDDLTEILADCAPTRITDRRAYFASAHEVLRAGDIMIVNSHGLKTASAILTILDVRPNGDIRMAEMALTHNLPSADRRAA